MTLQFPHQLARIHIPEGENAVAGRRDERFAVRGKRHTDRLTTAGNGTYLLAGLGIPERDGPAGADGGDFFAVGRVSQPKDEEAVPPAHRTQAGDGAGRQWIAVAIHAHLRLTGSFGFAAAFAGGCGDGCNGSAVSTWPSKPPTPISNPANTLRGSVSLPAVNVRNPASARTATAGGGVCSAA